MSKKIGVLTCVGGIDDPAKVKCIKECVNEVIGTDLKASGIGHHFVDRTISGFTPAKFIDEIIPRFNTKNQYYVFVGADEEALELSKHINLFDNIHILLSDHNSLNRVLNKYNLYKELKETQIAYPNYELVKSMSDIKKAIKNLNAKKNKIIVKPLYGRGGRGVYILGTPDNNLFSSKEKVLPIEAFLEMLKQSNFLDHNQELKTPLLMTEYLNGDAWSVDYLAYKGELICAIPKQKINGNAFTTTEALISNNQEIIEMVKKVIKLFNISYIGNIELKFNDHNQPALFDFNARIAASSGIYLDLGINFFKEAINLNKTGTCDLTQDLVKDNVLIKKYLQEFIV